MAFPYRFDFEKASKIWKATYKSWKLLNKSLILPNGFLNDLPVYISEFDFSTSNLIEGFFGKKQYETRAAIMFIMKL